MTTQTRRRFARLLNTVSDDSVVRLTILMKRIRVYGGRAYIRLDLPVLGMPPRIIGA